MYHTHLFLSFILSFCNLKSPERHHIKTAGFFLSVLITILITTFTNILLTKTLCYAKADSKNISTVFYSDAIIQKLTLSEKHDMITKAVQLRQNILYKDTIKRESINYYFIDTPADMELFCVECTSDKLSSDEIQFFDDTNKEIKVKISKQKKYFYTNINEIAKKAPAATRVYIAIGSSKAKNIKIICTKNMKHTKNISKPKNNITKKITHHKTTDKNKNKINITRRNVRNNNSKKNNVVRHNIKNNKGKKNNVIRHNIKNNKGKKNNVIRHNIRNNNSRKNNITQHNIKKNHHVTADNHKKSSNLYVSFPLKIVTLKRGTNTILTYKTNIKLTNKIKILWRSTNTNIVSIKGHKITAHRKGLAIITLTLKTQSICKTTTCTIRVT